MTDAVYERNPVILINDAKIGATTELYYHLHLCCEANSPQAPSRLDRWKGTVPFYINVAHAMPYLRDIHGSQQYPIRIAKYLASVMEGEQGKHIPGLQEALEERNPRGS